MKEAGRHMAEERVRTSHRLILENRQNGTITGVLDVTSFDEKEILVHTQAGKLVIKGEQLHVKRLNLEKGEVDIEGKTHSLTYLSKTPEKQEETLLRRLFR